MVRLALVCAALALVSCASCGSSIPAPRASSPSTSAQPAPPAPAPTEAVLPPRPEGPARAWSTLGTNLDWPADLREVTPFIDGFRLSRAGTSAPADGAPDDADVAAGGAGYFQQAACFAGTTCQSPVRARSKAMGDSVGGSM